MCDGKWASCVGGMSFPGAAASSYFVHDEPEERVVAFLAKVGTGIIDCRRRETQLPEGTVKSDLGLERLGSDERAGFWSRH